MLWDCLRYLATADSDRTPCDTLPSRIDETSVAWMTGTATVVACKRYNLFRSRLTRASPGEQHQASRATPRKAVTYRISKIALHADDEHAHTGSELAMQRSDLIP